MQLHKILIGFVFIALCLGGFYLQSQMEESGTTNPKVTDRLATEKAPKVTKQTSETVSAPKPAITSTAKIETVPKPNVTYAPSIVPKGMTVQEKKQRFTALVLPSINRVYQELNQRYKEVAAAIKNGTDGERIKKLKTEYRVETDQELLAALKPHPKSIVLAQAAMESAWGTSRFFTQAKNVFGVWSFDKNEPRIAAGKKRGDKTIWLKKYNSIYASVRDNYRVLAKSDAFEEFRTLRLKTNNPYELVKKLDRYSEKGDEYEKELASMIRFNKFTKYDSTLNQQKK